MMAMFAMSVMLVMLAMLAGLDVDALVLVHVRVLVHVLLHAPFDRGHDIVKPRQISCDHI